jgi:hypothetical protein
MYLSHWLVFWRCWYSLEWTIGCVCDVPVPLQSEGKSHHLLKLGLQGRLALLIDARTIFTGNIVIKIASNEDSTFYRGSCSLKTMEKCPDRMILQQLNDQTFQRVSLGIIPAVYVGRLMNSPSRCNFHCSLSLYVRTPSNRSNRCRIWRVR